MNWQPLSPDDGEIFAGVSRPRTPFCDYAPLLLQMWRKECNTEWAKIDGTLVLRGNVAGSGEKVFQIFATGEELRRTAHTLRTVCGNVEIEALDEEGCAVLQAAFPDRCQIGTSEAERDYLYEIDALAEMKGRGLAAKRNHIHAFLREHTGWTFSKITPENADKMRSFFSAFRQKEEDASESAKREGDADEEVIASFPALGGEGWMLEDGGEVLGFFIGEVIGTTLYLHIEKARRDVRGAYPLLVQETARAYRGKVKHENREEDDGDEGLRHSKRSYCPVAVLQKYRAVLS